MPDPLIQFETRSGESFRVGGRQITLFSKALTIRLPGMHAGLIWNRPSALLVTSEDGQEQVFPVVDITRQVLWGLLGATLALAWITLLFSMRRRRKSA